MPCKGCPLSRSRCGVRSEWAMPRPAVIQLTSPGGDVLVGTERVAMADAAGPEEGHRRQADVRMRTHVDADARFEHASAPCGRRTRTGRRCAPAIDGTARRTWKPPRSCTRGAMIVVMRRLLVTGRCTASHPQWPRAKSAPQRSVPQHFRSTAVVLTVCQAGCEHHRAQWRLTPQLRHRPGDAMPRRPGSRHRHSSFSCASGLAPRASETKVRRRPPKVLAAIATAGMQAEGFGLAGIAPSIRIRLRHRPPRCIVSRAGNANRW